MFGSSQSLPDEGSRLRDLTYITVIEAGAPKYSVAAHTRLLIQSSKYFEEHITRIQSARDPNLVIHIPLHYSHGAIQCFVDYLYAKEVMPRPERFNSYSIEACQLSRFIQSREFENYCERAIELNMKLGSLKPSILDLQRAIKHDLPNEIQNQVCDNIADRILAGKYEYNDDQNLVESSTQNTVDAAVAKRVQANGAAVRSDPSTNASGSNTVKSDNASNTAFGGGLFGSARPQQPVGLFGHGGGLFCNNKNQTQSSGGLFGQSKQNAGGLFGDRNEQPNQQANLFGHSQPLDPSKQSNGRLFGSDYVPPKPSGGLFGSSSQKGGAFGSNSEDRGLFGNNQNQTRTSGSLFDKPTHGGSGPFGTNDQPQCQSSGGLFGNLNTGGGLFGNNNGLFGHPANPNNGSNAFGQTSCSPFGAKVNTTVRCGSDAFGHNHGFGHNTGFGSTNSFDQHTCDFNGDSVHPSHRVCQKTASSTGTASRSFCFPKTDDNPPRHNSDYTFVEKEANGITCLYQHICFAEHNKNLSPEELRLSDYRVDGKSGLSQKQWPEQARPHDAAPPHAELNILRARVHKLEQDTSTLANKVYELEKDEAVWTKKVDELEKNAKLLSDRFHELETGGTTTVTGTNGPEKDEKTPTTVESLVVKHITAHTEILRQYLSTTTDLIRADIKNAQSKQRDDQQKTLSDNPATLVLRSKKVDQEAQEAKPTGAISGTSTTAIIFTPTSSTTSTPSPSPTGNRTTTETDDFINIEAGTLIYGQNKTSPTKQDRDTRTLQDEIWSKIPTVSPEARKLFSYLWGKSSSPDRPFVVNRSEISEDGGFDLLAIDQAIAELKAAEVMQYIKEIDLNVWFFSWGVKKA